MVRAAVAIPLGMAQIRGRPKTSAVAEGPSRRRPDHQMALMAAGAKRPESGPVTPIWASRKKEEKLQSSTATRHAEKQQKRAQTINASGWRGTRYGN